MPAARPFTAAIVRVHTRPRAGDPRVRPALVALLAVAAAAAPGCAPARPARPAQVCSVDGVAVLSRQGDVARLAGCTAVGGVVVRTGVALDLSPLVALTVIAGDLVIGPTVAIESVTLERLRRVGGAVRVASNGLLQGLYLPQLAEAGRIEVAGNAVIATISLPRLTAVRGALQVADDPALELLDVSALASIGQALVVTGVPALSLVDAPRLQRAAAVQLDAPRLPPEIAHALRAAAPAP